MGTAIGRKTLQLPVGELDHGRIEQLPQFYSAEELGEQAGVNGEGGRAAFGEGCIPLVHERGHVAKEQGAREGTGDIRGHVDESHGTGTDLARERGEGGKVVDVLQALTQGLENDWEGRVFPGDLQQLGRLLALLPEGRAGAGVVARQQKGARGALAKTGSEQRRSTHLVGDDRFEFVGFKDEQFAAGRVGFRVGDAHDDAVVARNAGAVDAVAFSHPGSDRKGPGGVHLRAERRVQHDSPVPQFVTEPFHDQGAVGGQMVGGLTLVTEEREQVRDRTLVEAAGRAPGAGLFGTERPNLAHEGADRRSEFGRSAEAVALPERQSARLAERGGDEHLVMSDFLNTPARRSQGKDIAHARFIDHFLIELTDPAAGSGP